MGSRRWPTLASHGLFGEAMEQRSLIVEFGDSSLAEANQYAQDLQQTLQEVDSSVEVQRRRTRTDTQDFGASLVLIFGTQAAFALARGIQSWLARNSGAKVTLKTPSGEVVALNLDSRDASRIVAALSRG